MTAVHKRSDGGSLADIRIEPGTLVWVPDKAEVWRAGIFRSLESRTRAESESVDDGAEALLDLEQRGKRAHQRVRVSALSKAGDPPAFLRRNPELVSVEDCRAAHDLALLTLLYEPELLYALEVRFEQGLVYTMTGPMLIAVNPFQALPELYSPKLLQDFVDLKPKAPAPMPHAFGIARLAYDGVWREGSSQTVLVSGESGAGKTETTKFVMKYLAVAGAGGGQSEMSAVERRVLESIPLLEALGNAKTLRNDNSSRFGKYIELQFRPSGDEEGRPRLNTAKTNTYLLEKVRVMQPKEGERSFHVFYQLLAAVARAPADDAPAVAGIELRGLRGRRPADFEYLSSSSCTALPGQDEAADLETTVGAMHTFGFSSPDIADTLAVLAAVLHAGNIKFKLPADNSEGSQISDSDAHSSLEETCSLLGVEVTSMESALTQQKIKMVGENRTITRPVSIAQASDGRDALARHVYGAIFNLVVAKVNDVLGTDDEKESAATRPRSLRRLPSFEKVLPFVGVLDIFGFEYFENNSFEQLCINFTNELLQQHFNEVIFQHEATTYAEEQIEWTPQDFPDNNTIVEMLAGELIGVLPGPRSLQVPPSDTGSSLRQASPVASNERTRNKLGASVTLLVPGDQASNRSVSPRAPPSPRGTVSGDVSPRPGQRDVSPRFGASAGGSSAPTALGLFPMLDEECSLPRGGAQPWVRKLVATYSKHEAFEVVRTRRDTHFRVKHFAGPVEYNSELFLEKNKDKLSPDMVECMKCSTNGFVQRLFSEQGRIFGARVNETAGGNRRVSRAIAYTVSSEFRKQLQTLMGSIRATTPHFIRCIKPNPEKVAKRFSRQDVVEQLRYQGVLQAIEVSRAGYPVRFTHREAVLKYWRLVNRRLQGRLELEVMRGAFADAALALFEESARQGIGGLTPHTVQVGVTRIFFKREGYEALQTAIQTLRKKAAASLQKHWRGFVCRRRYFAIRSATIALQSGVRGMFSRRLAKRLRRTRAALRLQSSLRGRRGRKIANHRRRGALIVQKWLAARVQRFYFLRVMRMTLRVQRFVRHTMVRRWQQNRARAVTVIQSHRRSIIVRRRTVFMQGRVDKRRWAALKLLWAWRRKVLLRMRERVVADLGTGEMETVESVQGRAGEFAGSCAAVSLLLQRLDTKEKDLLRRRDVLARESSELAFSSGRRFLRKFIFLIRGAVYTLHIVWHSWKTKRMLAVKRLQCAERSRRARAIVYELREAAPERQLLRLQTSMALRVQRWARRTLHRHKVVGKARAEMIKFRAVRSADQAQTLANTTMIIYLHEQEDNYAARLATCEADLRHVEKQVAEGNELIDILKLQEDETNPDSEEEVHAVEVREKRRWFHRAEAEVEVPAHLADFVGNVRTQTEALPSANMSRQGALADVVVQARQAGETSMNADAVAGGTIKITAPAGRAVRQRVKLFVKKREQLAHRRAKVEEETADFVEKCQLVSAEFGRLDKELERWRDLAGKISDPATHADPGRLSGFYERAQQEVWDGERCCREFSAIVGVEVTPSQHQS